MNGQLTTELLTVPNYVKLLSERIAEKTAKTCPLCCKSGCSCTYDRGPFNLYYGLDSAGVFVTLELALNCHRMLANLKAAPARLTDRHGVPVEIISLNEQR